MKPLRCPDPAHAAEAVALKANNDRVFECPSMHKYWRREAEGKIHLVNLITQEVFQAEDLPGDAAAGQAERPRLNFMVDVPRLAGNLDFNALSLTPPQWKVIARVDGKANLEEVRLLSGLSSTEAESVINELIGAGLVEVRRRGGR
ncbi:MAG TPA: hypothetical protein VJV23_02355 [Candidatus Polarisedimenticolia bacterium]|nr:hypothetical protein [Candidatus Polarisedimenticolia bacterium]